MIGAQMRKRMAYATLLPVLLVVSFTAAAFWIWRVQDLEDTHQRRLQLLAHQVSIFCANGLFSGNVASLQNVINQVQREPGLRAVYVFDQTGELIAESGGQPHASLQRLSSQSYLREQAAQGMDVLYQPIESTLLPMDDLFASGVSARPLELGATVLEFSRADLEQSKRTSLMTALLIGLAGVSLGWWLALRLSRSVVMPVMRIYQKINRIGAGDLAPQPELPPDAMLRGLEDSLNEMAQRLAWGRDELESQVQSVTRELRQKMLQAQDATQAKSKFLASASHDLRQPAHALGMFVARLHQLPLDPQMRQLATQMEVSVQSMQDLLDSLLDLSQLDSGTVRVRIEPVDMQVLLETVRQSASGGACHPPLGLDRLQSAAPHGGQSGAECDPLHRARNRADCLSQPAPGTRRTG
jgi:two-component system, sensor histidine kinase